MRTPMIGTLSNTLGRTLAALLLLASCKAAEQDDCPQDGVEGCPCSDGLCIGDLQCLSNFCVDPGASGLASDPTTGKPPGASEPDPGDTGAPDPGDTSEPGPTSTTVDPNTGGDPQCSDGYTSCAGECVDLAAHPEHCGQCGEACPVGDVCSAAQCKEVLDCTKSGCEGFTHCDPGSKKCLPGCDFNPQCPTGKHCDPETHACVCTPGNHACGDLCKPDDDPLACGPDCVACPEKENTLVACKSGKCTYTCDFESADCGGTCYNIYEQAICPDNKDTCTVCPPVENGYPTCYPEDCYPKCDTFYEVCDGKQCKGSEYTFCEKDSDCCQEKGLACLFDGNKYRCTEP